MEEGGKISLKELKLKLFNATNEDNCNDQHDQEIFLSDSEMINFYYTSLCFPKLDELFANYGSSTSSNSRMATKQFQNFLNKEQGIDLPFEECCKYIKAFEQQQGSDDDEVFFSKDGFIKFMMFSLLIDIVDIFNNHIVYQKMTEPLCHYWIDSSHNTYVISKKELLKRLAFNCVFEKSNNIFFGNSFILDIY